MRTSNKIPLSVISLYKDAPVLSGDNMLNDRPVESCIKVQPKDNSITLTNEGVPINATHPTGILAKDCDTFDIGLHVNTKKSVEEKVELIHKLGIPNETFCFPKNKGNKRFNHHWLARYPWLCYSKYNDGPFCLCCVLFGDHAKGGRFVCSTFTDWKHAIDKFASHASNQKLHILPYEQYITFRNTFFYHNRQPVNIQLDKINQNQISKNRQILSSIVKAVLFCARQNIALRGHRNDACHLQSPENNSGNFQNLLNRMENCGDDVPKQHFKNAPRNATYRSKTTQNNIIDTSAKFLTDNVVNEVKEAKYFSILAD